MPREIKKPAKKQYWLVTNGTDVLHIGTTDVNQVTTTGLTTIEAADSEQELVDNLQKHIDVVKEDLPARGIREGRAYKYDGEVVVPKRDAEVLRNGECNPEDHPECFTRKTR
jgi:hypothetical protein